MSKCNSQMRNLTFGLIHAPNVAQKLLRGTIHRLRYMHDHFSGTQRKSDCKLTHP